jgi:valyl-tRNA synthetase
MEGFLCAKEMAMTLPRRYHPAEAEPRLARFWQEQGTYHFDPASDAPVYSIDTPPPTVSGYLHLGHVYSYSHPDFIARFWRMNGHNVYYPMGYDDNGLPTERLVEKQTGRTAEEMGREAFIAACLELTVEFEREYQALWQRLGLSIDWRYTYRTIDDLSRTTAQRSFLDLLDRGLVYRRRAPAIWCPHCHTAIAQAEEKDLERTSQFVTLPFTLEDGRVLPIATTRPELLPACVAVFVHPDDERYQSLAGRTAHVPLFGLEVLVLADPHADPTKGTGAVMCCTFGDTVDVEWWLTHDLPLREALDRRGRLTAIAGLFAGLSVSAARAAVIERLESDGLLLARQPTEQSVRVHERCDTPVEYIVTQQWFVRVLDSKEAFLGAGARVNWYPAGMQIRYREWVENLHWDWCISRQRYYGVPFPVWYCSCGTTLAADQSQLPVDPTTQRPPGPCICGSEDFTAEEDVMDTWATSCCSPQIAGRLLIEPDLYRRVFPMSLRPQAHEIIRTWAFDTIVMSHYRFGAVPWKDVLISGWGVAAGGTEKISKSRGGGPMAPMAMLERYSADAARYWAASTGPGKDAVISEEKIGAGQKLVTKLWNVAVFAQRFLDGYQPPTDRPALSPADRWLLHELQELIRQATAQFAAYEYASAKSATETFFWSVLADNYLEMAKKRLYDADNPGHEAARYTLQSVLLTVITLFAPILPYVTEEIYQGLFRQSEGCASIHRSRWPEVDDSLIDPAAHDAGEALVAIANAVRRYKSERHLSLGAELPGLHVQAGSEELREALVGAEDDIAGVTRAQIVDLSRDVARSSPATEAAVYDLGSMILTIQARRRHERH